MVELGIKLGIAQVREDGDAPAQGGRAAGLKVLRRKGVIDVAEVVNGQGDLGEVLDVLIASLVDLNCLCTGGSEGDKGDCRDDE